MSSSNKKTFISTFNSNITIQNLNKQYKSQSDSNNNNINIIEIFTSYVSSHHTEIPISTVTKDHFHQQSLLEFSCEQLKDNPIQSKFNTIINQIDDQFTADFYELVAAWQWVRMQGNTQVV